LISTRPSEPVNGVTAIIPVFQPVGEADSWRNIQVPCPQLDPRSSRDSVLLIVFRRTKSGANFDKRTRLEKWEFVIGQHWKFPRVVGSTVILRCYGHSIAEVEERNVLDSVFLPDCPM